MLHYPILRITVTPGVETRSPSKRQVLVAHGPHALPKEYDTRTPQQQPSHERIRTENQVPKRRLTPQHIITSRPTLPRALPTIPIPTATIKASAPHQGPLSPTTHSPKGLFACWDVRPSLWASPHPTLDAASAPIDGDVVARLRGGEALLAEAEGDDPDGGHGGGCEKGPAAVPRSPVLAPVPLCSFPVQHLGYYPSTLQ